MWPLPGPPTSVISYQTPYPSQAGPAYLRPESYSLAQTIATEDRDPHHSFYYNSQTGKISSVCHFSCSFSHAGIQPENTVLPVSISEEGATSDAQCRDDDGVVTSPNDSLSHHNPGLAASTAASSAVGGPFLNPGVNDGFDFPVSPTYYTGDTVLWKSTRFYWSEVSRLPREPEVIWALAGAHADLPGAHWARLEIAYILPVGPTPSPIRITRIAYDYGRRPRLMVQETCLQFAPVDQANRREFLRWSIASMLDKLAEERCVQGMEQVMDGVLMTSLLEEKVRENIFKEVQSRWALRRFGHDELAL